MEDTADFNVTDPIREEFLNKSIDENVQMQTLTNSGPLLVAMEDIDNFSVMSSIREEFLFKRIDEKGQIQVLNNRFAAYIKNNRALKKENRELAMELEILRRSTSESITEIRTEEMSKLIKDNGILTKEIISLKVERDSLKISLDQETRLKVEAEKARDELKAALEAEKEKRKNETHELGLQLKHCKKVHKEELTKMRIMIKGLAIDQTDGAKSDLTAELLKIREQYEAIAAENIAKAEMMYKIQIQKINKTVTAKNEELSKANKTITELNFKINKLTSENTSLNTTINNMKRHQKEERDEWEFKYEKINVNMANKICEYQKLLCVKMELDMEISYYRKLLEEEEDRIRKYKHDHSTPIKTDIIQRDGHPEMTPSPTSDKSSDTNINIKTEITETTTIITKVEKNVIKDNSGVAVSQEEVLIQVTPASTNEMKSPTKEKPRGPPKMDQKPTPKNPDSSPKSPNTANKPLKVLVKK